MDSIVEKITALWRKTPKAIRSGWITAWVTFTGTLLTILTSLLPNLANAISTKNFEPFYDALSTSATLSVSAATGFFAGLVNAIYRWARPIEQAYRSAPPDDPGDGGDDGGYVFPQWLALVIGIGLVILIIWAIFTYVIDVEDDEAIRAVLMR